MATDGARRAVLAVLAAAVCGLSVAAQHAGLKVTPGDQLDVRVWGIDHYTREYPVAPDGSLDFPDLGRIKVSGLTTREIEAELAKRLKDGGFVLSPQVTVALKQAQNQQVTVSGAVVVPGVISYAGELRVFEAIVRAGQATAAASDEVLIIRAAPAGANGSAAEPAQVLEVNLSEFRRGDLTNNLALVTGDLIIVREAQDFFISGEVRAPGPYPVRAGLTVEQALALAGGLTERGSTRRIEIKRQGLGDPLKGVKLDELVKPGDMIKVNRSIM